MLIIVKSTSSEAGSPGVKKAGETSGSLAPSSDAAKHLPDHFVPCFQCSMAAVPFD